MRNPEVLQVLLYHEVVIPEENFFPFFFFPMTYGNEILELPILTNFWISVEMRALQ